MHFYNFNGNQSTAHNKLNSIFINRTSASLNKANVFSSGTDMIQNISNVIVGGGNDCPELAAAGILNGKYQIFHEVLDF